MKFFAAVVATLATIVAGLGSQACVIFWIDEPEMPKSLIK